MSTQSLPYAHLGEALATDYFQVREQFTDEQWEHFLTTRRFVDEEVLPAINEYWEAAELPWPLMRSLAELGLYGEDIAGYGCPGMSPLARGLVNMELHRGDGSVGTFLGVQSGQAMKSIDMHGSEAQKERWLPALARLDAVGAFALTEPDHERWYAAQVRRAGDPGKLRQLYVGRGNHCSFSAADELTELRTLFQRIETGRWPDTSPERTNQESAAFGDPFSLVLDLGTFTDAPMPPAFTEFTPPQPLRPSR